MPRPLIIVTNDDGIASAGLWAIAECVLSLGDVIVVAPDRQWSGCGRSMPHDVTGAYTVADRTVAGANVPAYAVDASPALTVVHAITEFAPRRPSLVVSGINSGANMSVDVTISGTVGAALEAAALGIPAIAVSLEMDPAYHLTGDETADYTAAQAFAYRFATQMLGNSTPYDLDVLNINVPSDATPSTEWRMTRLSRHRYGYFVAADRASGEGRPRYVSVRDVEHAESDSDIHAVKIARAVSVTPLSLDLTSRGINHLPLWEMSVTAMERLHRGEVVA